MSHRCSDKLVVVSESAKKNKAQPNGLTLFDQTPGRNNFIDRKTRPTGQINNMTMRVVLIRSGVKYDRRHVKTAFPSYMLSVTTNRRLEMAPGQIHSGVRIHKTTNGLTLFDRTPSQKEVPKPNGYFLQEKPNKAHKMTITL